jgi:hypothetical protein
VKIIILMTTFLISLLLAIVSGCAAPAPTPVSFPEKPAEAVLEPESPTTVPKATSKIEEVDFLNKRIRIKAGVVEALAELNDSDTAQAIWDILPIKSRANTWGDEIYFDIQLSIAQEKGQELVEVGDLGYWPSGKSFCIFFGPTPASEGDKPRAASSVTVFGQIVGDATIFKQVHAGTEVTIEKETSDK